VFPLSHVHFYCLIIDDVLTHQSQEEAKGESKKEKVEEIELKSSLLSPFTIFFLCFRNAFAASVTGRSADENKTLSDSDVITLIKIWYKSSKVKSGLIGLSFSQ
jgi:hypothetical protein